MALWIVGRLHAASTYALVVWDFQGVFDSKDKAVAACRNERYFVAPATLNTALPHETVTWPGCYYPKAKQAAGA